MKKVIKPSVLLISIDALNPYIVFNSEKLGIKLPTLYKYFIENGTYASRGSQGVFPTMTYPSHQSIITGTYPATHGIYTNTVFDPTNEHLGAWNWYVSDNVPTLWEYAKENDYLSVNAVFPTSVGAKSDYNIPEFWRDCTELDSKVLDAVSTPQGLVKELKKDTGIFPSGCEFLFEGDLKRYVTALWLLEDKVKPLIHEKPFFMTTYLASYDENAHDYGTYSKEALGALEKLDKLVEKLLIKAHEITNDNIVVAVVSDHGMLNNIANIRPNTLFYKAGLLTLDANGNVTDWEAWCQRSGGAGQIRLKDPNNHVVREKVEAILNQLLKDKNSKIIDVLTGKEAAATRKGFPEADYVIISKPGYEIREDSLGEYFNPVPTQKAQHGYSEYLPEMRASFFVEGINIPQGKDICELKIVDIAPTLANIMGFSMETAEGKSFFKKLTWCANR